MDLTQLAEMALKPVVSALSSVLFFDVGGMPLILLWLMVAALFFTAYLRGVNIRLLPHSFHLITSKNTEDAGSGEISQLQAFLSAISATVGLGSIVGVSVSVAVGGPGAIFWIIVMGFFSMATKFAEVTLSLLYRKVDADGKAFGGPIHYLEDGFRDIGYARLGKFLAVVFAIFSLGGAIAGGNMFQSNATVKIFADQIPALKPHAWLIAAAFAALVGCVLFGSIKRIAKVAEAVGPLKGIVYLACTLIVVGCNIHALPHALGLIFHEAFSASAVKGGFIGMLIIAFRRALFANEAGLGSAPIAHAAARVEEPAREGSIALMEPLFAAFIALLTGLMVVITNAYQGVSLEDGVLIAVHAFASVGDWFTVMLAVCVFLFAYGTTIGWSYYGEISWVHLFGRRSVKLYYVIYTLACFVGGIVTFGVIMDLGDLLILGAALPNIIALYVLRKRIKAEMLQYMAGLKH